MLARNYSLWRVIRYNEFYASEREEKQEQIMDRCLSMGFAVKLEAPLSKSIAAFQIAKMKVKFWNFKLHTGGRDICFTNTRGHS